MNVYCQNCKKATAIVHVTDIKDGKKIELHLCEDCAESQGLPPKVHPVSMIDFLHQWVEKSSGTGKTDPRCDHCGMTFHEFKAHGRFGCPRDYEVFQSRVIPLLERIHGASAQAGVAAPSPTREAATTKAKDQLKQTPPALSPELAELDRLRSQLSRVVESEQYEEAARIRDRIHELERGLEAKGKADG